MVRPQGGQHQHREDLGTGHRLSLLGADLTASTVAVLDEPNTEPSGLTNLHALAFTASARPDRDAAAVAHLPAAISCPAKVVLVAREWADEAVLLIGAPLIGAAVVSAWWAGPAWTAVAAAGVLLHPGRSSPPACLPGHPFCIPLSPHRRALAPCPGPSPNHPTALVAASPLQPFIRLVGPWRLIGAKATGRHRADNKHPPPPSGGPPQPVTVRVHRPGSQPRVGGDHDADWPNPLQVYTVRRRGGCSAVMRVRTCPFTPSGCPCPGTAAREAGHPAVCSTTLRNSSSSRVGLSRENFGELSI